MKYDLNILFFIRKVKQDKTGKVPVYCRITVNGERVEFSTNEKIEVDKWDSGAQRIKGRSELARTMNNHIDIVENKIKAIFNKLLDSNELISSQILKDHLSGKADNVHYLVKIFEENNKLIKLEEGSKYGKATISRYITTLNRLKEFIRINYLCDDVAIEKLDVNFIRRFEIYLRTEHQIIDSTTMKYLKQLKRVIHYAMEMGYLKFDPFRQYKTAFKQVNRGYLTQGELSTIEEKKFQIIRLDRVRDVFIFACYTGFSYADLKLLTPNSISKGIDGKNWIIYEREKTGVRASIPILPEAQRIIDKYKNDPECIANNMLLPVKSNQKLNSYLSEIEELCEIEKHITMHLARHTFATTVTLSNGVPIETVSKMLGHTNLKTTQIYSKVIDTKISEDMDKVQERLAKRKIS